MRCGRRAVRLTPRRSSASSSRAARPAIPARSRSTSRLAARTHRPRCRSPRPSSACARTSSRSTRSAWALAANGRTAEARSVIARALAEGTEDGRLFLHAGDHSCRRGRAARGRTLAAEGGAPALDAPAVGTHPARQTAHRPSTHELGERHEEESCAESCPRSPRPDSSLAGPPDATASSHMDAPLIVLDDAANTTDVYAFVQGTERTQVAGDGARRLPVRGAGHRPEQVQLRRQRALRHSRRAGEGRRRRTADALVRVPLHDAVQEPPHDPAVVPRRRQRRGRRGAEPDAVLLGDQGRSPHRPADPARHGHRAAEQPGQRHAVLQPGRQRREAGQGRRRHRRPARSLHAAVDRLARRRLSSPLPASATTASTATSRRSSICCSCATPARMRSVDSTST